MYSKCGCLEKAKDVFEYIVSKDVILLNAMIMGLAVNGEGRDAPRLFYKIEFGLKPNGSTRNDLFHSSQVFYIGLKLGAAAYRPRLPVFLFLRH
ncbi:hypothetical protein PIB30_092638 [Stylosanthes scabra]|uniref:Pentatricopeptide repeat-containing protein n=1 Tax=Stylosanthes scabra TaxID=79078 RepID=A0ABU6ZTI5_9FABA|nr:hypothetical protein [Stylosanthes scabra]